MHSSLLLLSTLVATAWGCPKHDNYQSHPHLGRRTVKRATGREPHDWDYDHSADWHTIKPEYVLCNSGTTQSPINLDGYAVSSTHKPKFEGYTDTELQGNWFNWEFGPAFTPHHPEGDVSGLPSFTFDDKTVFNIGWHLHAPSEHLIDGVHSRAEIHMVHANEAGEAVSVLGIRLAVAPPEVEYESAFIKQFGDMIHFNDTQQIEGVPVNFGLAIQELNGMKDGFWTYRGSLTTPPCSEGLRWFLPKREMVVSEAQMVSILAASKFSHRVTQDVWRHDINV